MKKKLLTLCTLLLVAITHTGYTLVMTGKQLKQSKQLLLVLVPDVNKPNATLRFYQRKKTTDAWALQAINKRKSIPVVIGSAGLAGSDKKEGDNRSPAGIFAIPTAFGIQKNEHPFMPYISINQNTVCVDDANSKFYNKIVDASLVGSQRDWAHAEMMRREAPMYNAGLQVAYNPSNLPGKGSCIFIHQWRSPHSGTAGCTAMDSDAIKYLVKTLKQQDHPVLVQLPKKSMRITKNPLTLSLSPID